MFWFNCGEDSKNTLKGFSNSQSLHIKGEEKEKSLDGETYQKKW